MLLTNSVSSLMCSSEPAASDSSSGGGSDNTNPTGETVRKEVFDRVLSETKSEREKRQAAERELEKYREKERLAAEQAALERGEFDKVLEAERHEKKRIADQLAERDRADLERNKFGALVRALGGKSIHEKFHNLIDLDRIVVGADGKIDPASVTKYAQEFQTDYAMIFSEPGTVNFPNAAPAKPGVSSNWDAEPVTRKNLRDKKANLSSAVEEFKRNKGIK